MTTARGASVDARETATRATEWRLERISRILGARARRGDEGEGDEERAMGRFISGHIQ